MEVLIIGAGVAGLAAAQTLSGDGVKTRIVEARKRIGGRIWTVRPGTQSAPVELGAEFIHGRAPNLFDAAHQAGLVTRPMSESHEYLRDGRPVEGRDLFAKVDQVFQRLGDARQHDQTFAEFIAHIDADSEACALAKSYVEGFNAARADRISTRALAFESKAQDEIGGDQSFRFEDGYDRLPEWLWRQCGSNATLDLGTLVEGLEWRPGRVSLTCRRGSGEVVTATADRAIVTLPLGVLQAAEFEPGAVRIDPRPARIDGALQRLEMGHAVRVTLLFNEAFWQENPQLREAGFMHTDNAVFPTWWTTLPGDVRGLTAWAGGPKAENAVGLGDSEISGRAVDSLAQILGSARDAVEKQIETRHVHNWSRDPFARGAYSYARVGGLEAREQLAEPVEGTLYFAGEASDVEGHGATVHGALASGRRAANQILMRG